MKMKMKNTNGTLSRAKKSKFPAIALGLSLAIAAPAMGAQVIWQAGGAGLWSVDANWRLDDPATDGIAPDGIKTVVGEDNYGVVGANDVTLNTVALTLPVFEIYGAGTLNIVTGGVLTIEGGDEEFFIYTSGGPGDGNVGTTVNLLGGELIFVDGTDFDFAGGLFTPGGSLVTDTTTMAGYTIYSNTIPEPSSMGLLALGGLALIRRRRRA